MIKAGISKIDITPPVGSYLQGHTARNKPSEKVHDPLYLKILSLNDGSKRTVFITADLVGFSEKFILDLEKLLKSERINPEECFISASHTHTGPFILEGNLWTRNDTEKFLPQYLSMLKGKIIEGIKETISKEQEVEINYGKGIADIGIINRRKKNQEGRFEMAPNPEGPRDCEISVITFKRENTPLAILFNYSCHPTTLSTDIYEISADYPGVAQKIVEDYYGCIALFTNGFCGDVRPAVIEGYKFKGGDFEDIERMGRVLGNSVIEIAEKSMRLDCEKIIFKKGKLQLPFDREYLFKSAEEIENKFSTYRMLNERNYQIWKEYWIKNLEKGIKVPEYILCDVSIVKIGDIKIIGLGGEVAVEYGLKIKEKEKNAIVVGYCGVDIGYIPTKKIIKEGGYEAEVFLLYGYPAPFSLEIEEIILNYIFTNIS